MSLPTPDKTWQFNVNQTKPTLAGGYTYDYKALLLQIKKSLTSFSSNPWTVTGSSNSLTAGYDSVDRWTVVLTGTDTNTNVNTSTNNTLRIRTTNSYFYVFTVTAGASTAKTTIQSDLNTAFAAAGLTLSASITGTNQLTISDTSSNAYIEMDTVANGSTLGTSCGFASAGVRTIDCLVNGSVGVAHSWIVLKQAGIHSNFELCIDMTGASYIYFMTTVIGLSGFSGGTTLNRPTATTSITLNNNGNWYRTDSTTFGSVLHAMQSTDGQCTRLVAFYNGTPVLFWLFDKPKNPVSGWTNPSVCVTACNQLNGSVTYCGYYNGTARVSAYMNSVAASCYLTCEGIGANPLPSFSQFQQRNQVTQEHIILPIGIASDTANAKGRHGQLFDMWWGSTVNAVGGMDATFPDDGTNTFWQCDGIVFPWVGLISSPGPIPLVRW